MEVLIAFDLGKPWVEQLAQRFPAVNFSYRPSTSNAAVAAHLGEAQVLFAYHAAIDSAQAPRLRWVQLTGAGYDHLRGHAILNGGVTITNAPVFGAPIAEYVLAAMLALSRDLARIWRDFGRERAWPANHWATHAGFDLRGQALAVVGYGHVGREIARLGRALGMRVMATRASTAEPYDDNGVQVLPARELRRLLAFGDFVVLCAPLTAATERLLGAAELAWMKPGACLINVGRGKLVDEAALVDALRTRRLKGAALDVFAAEPLPPDSPLFDLPNVLLSPHISGVSQGYYGRVVELFANNLERFLAGLPLRHVVAR
jgi:phosphoglycerate dehydrogenase-like enzyme